MSRERNVPCPCGSGKKYKKCCLAKDEAAARASVLAAGRATEEQRQAVEAAQTAEWQKQRQEWAERSADQPPTDSFEAESAPELPPHEPLWPPLPAEDQQLVEAWWQEVGPVYTGHGVKEQCGWLLERVLAFLDQHPRLFRHLHLHDEFLFELAGALTRAGRKTDYVALLRRLRDEQPELYFQCFGYYDEGMLAEALRTGRREDIPACLRLFREHPVDHIDQFATVVDLLAWRGCEAELRELLEPTARTIAESPEVLGGEFGLQWLTNLAIFPFLEAGDDSPKALESLYRAAFAAGFLDEDDPGNRKWLRRAVKMASRSAAEAHLDLKDIKSKWLQMDAAWNFTGWARRTKGLTWSSARFLADALLTYWGWCEDRNQSDSPFGLNPTQLDHYLAQSCRDFITLNGLRALSTLQAFHYFTEYLVAHDCFSAADAARLQAAAAGLFEIIQGALDPCDPASWVCPTYETLVAAPGPASGIPANPTPSPMPAGDISTARSGAERDTSGGEGPSDCRSP